MKRKVFLVGVLLLLPLVGMFAAAREAASWRPVRVGVSPGAYSLSVSRGGWIQTATANDEVLQRGEQTITGAGCVNAFFSADESLVALSDYDGEVLRIVRTADGKVISVWHKPPLQEGEYLLAGRFENHNRNFVAVSCFSVSRFDIARGNVSSQVKMRFPLRNNGLGAPVYGISFLKNGDLYYLNGDEGVIVDARTGIAKRKAAIGTLSPDQLLLGSWSFATDKVFIIDFAMGKGLWEAESDIHPVFSPDSHSLLVVQDGKLRLFNARDGKLIRQLNIPPTKYYAFSPDGDTLYSLQHNGQILRWRLR